MIGPDAEAREAMMRDWGTGVHWWGWVLGIAATAVFWALVIWAIVALVRWARTAGTGPRAAGGRTARGAPAAPARRRRSRAGAGRRRDEAQAGTTDPDREPEYAHAARRPGPGPLHRYRERGYGPA